MSLPTLGTRFATAFSELAVPWEAARVEEPRPLVVNRDLAAEVEFDAALLHTEDGARFLVGNTLPDGARPVAQAYAGHQFGGYSPRLGDGRALLLGELPTGRDLHLKGSGRTPFARGGDGLAAVGPMLREYLVSESMHALGVPTTRSLAVVGTGTPVLRERALPGAVLARVAASHLRVGTFQFARSTGDTGLLRRLVDHAIERHHPESVGVENPALELYTRTVAAQAELVARWMLLGFVHGVMNTDNVTISGETIDYGPCAFMEAHDPATVFSSIDTQGRYAYGNQPVIAQWNLARFAETLVPLVDDDPQGAVALLTVELETFPTRYETAWRDGMRTKLGLGAGRDDGEIRVLTDDLVSHLVDLAPDHTSFFVALTRAAGGDDSDLRTIVGGGLDGWLDRWLALHPSADVMAHANPVYIPRNHLVEEALDAASAGDLGPFEALLSVVTGPFVERAGLERFARPAPPGASPCVTYCGT